MRQLKPNQVGTVRGCGWPHLSGRSKAMKRPWWLSALTWDGVLPLLMMVASGSLAVFFPRSDTADLAAVVLLPMIAALVRASIGLRQLAAICGKHPSILRQVLFAAAIATLLMFEMYSGFLVRGRAPWLFWWPAGALYVVYLAFMVCSVRPGTNLPPKSSLADPPGKCNRTELGLRSWVAQRPSGGRHAGHCINVLPENLAGWRQACFASRCFR